VRGIYVEGAEEVYVATREVSHISRWRRRASLMAVASQHTIIGDDG